MRICGPARTQGLAQSVAVGGVAFNVAPLHESGQQRQCAALGEPEMQGHAMQAHRLCTRGQPLQDVEHPQGRLHSAAARLNHFRS